MTSRFGLPVLNNAAGGGVGGAFLGGVGGGGGRLEGLFRGVVGASPAGERGEVRFGLHDRMLYSTDASLYQVAPLGVVVPGSVAEAERLARVCLAEGAAILPRGGGTSLAGQCVNEAVVFDFSARCRGVKWVDAERRLAEVEPGIYVDELNGVLRERFAREGWAGGGLFFAADPATVRQAAIGGCIGNNAAGMRSVRYGRTSENVREIDALTGEGRRVRFGPLAGRRDVEARRIAEAVSDVCKRHAGLIRERYPKTVRRNAGYGLDMVLGQLDRGVNPVDLDLTGLLCGSEGTLALTLGAMVKLHPSPRARGLAVVAFASVEAAIEAVADCLDVGATAVEMLDDVVLMAARGNLQTSGYVDLLPRVEGGGGPSGFDPRAVLYVEFLGFSDVGGAGGEAEAGEEVRERVEMLRERLVGLPMSVYTDEAALNKAWLLRKYGEPLLHGLPGSRKPVTFVEDNAVPVERLGEFVREFKKIVGRHGTVAAYWAHASVGVLHIRPMIDLHDAGDRERLRMIAVEAADLARRVGGVMSGEHGDGRVRGPLLERFYGRELMGAFREVKAIFDPLNLLNPGNIVSPGPVESITARLRTRPMAVTDSVAAGEGGSVCVPEVDTYFDYGDQQGFGHAVEMCNGSGVCRKRSGGVMCPSYMGTLDERHSTRGRGNALRLALTGQLDLARRAVEGGVGGGVGGGGGADWNDAGTIETLDLCLSCKACKAECPSNVDIARLKAEYTAQRYRECGRVPMKARVIGHVRVLNRVGSMSAGIANAVNRSRVGKWAAERLFGIDRRRDVPAFSRSLYRRWEGEVVRAEAIGGGGGDVGGDRRSVALFADCFTAYNEPGIGVAAGRLLRRLGYEVRLSGQGGLVESAVCAVGGGGFGGGGGCCGRSMISVGLLEDAD